MKADGALHQIVLTTADELVRELAMEVLVLRAAAREALKWPEEDEFGKAIDEGFATPAYRGYRAQLRLAVSLGQDEARRWRVTIREVRPCTHVHCSHDATEVSPGSWTCMVLDCCCNQRGGCTVAAA